MSRGIQSFVCIALHVRHSVGSCVLRFKKGDDPVCRRCPIGAEHAKGKLPTHWPENRGSKPIVRLEVIPFDRIPARRRRIPAA